MSAFEHSWRMTTKPEMPPPQDFHTQPACYLERRTIPLVNPSQKCGWGKHNATEWRFRPDLLEPRFWIASGLSTSNK